MSFTDKIKKPRAEMRGAFLCDVTGIVFESTAVGWLLGFVRGVDSHFTSFKFRFSGLTWNGEMSHQ